MFENRQESDAEVTLTAMLVWRHVQWGSEAQRTPPDLHEPEERSDDTAQPGVREPRPRRDSPGSGAQGGGVDVKVHLHKVLHGI